MKKLVLAASVLVLGTAAASAADLSPRYYKAPPPMVAAMYDWSGFYAGVNGGWGTSHNCWTRTATLGVGIARAAEGCHDSSGGTVGGQLGYRWQAGPWVVGLEAQGNWADFSGSNVSLLFAGAATNRTRIDAFGLFTGQVGYAWNNVLGYVKGGAAVTDNRYDGLATLTGTVTDRARDTRWGATVGAGIEYGFAPHWSAALEYDHLFMGTNNYAMTSVFPVAGFNTRNVDVKQDADLVTVRVNYRFGGPVVARY
ncbi:MAG TPA: outer membrane beta-barrel protein [Bradyrhizobium sp.]|nr:outer membrane beta-barrel protein [Bradyrhizobium sp.]